MALSMPPIGGPSTVTTGQSRAGSPATNDPEEKFILSDRSGVGIVRKALAQIAKRTAETAQQSPLLPAIPVGCFPPTDLNTLIRYQVEMVRQALNRRPAALTTQGLADFKAMEARSKGAPTSFGEYSVKALPEFKPGSYYYSGQPDTLKMGMFDTPVQVVEAYLFRDNGGDLMRTEDGRAAMQEAGRRAQEFIRHGGNVTRLIPNLHPAVPMGFGRVISRFSDVKE